MKIYIYQIWFPISKKSYIGQTHNIKRRMDQHFESGSLVCKALWKYDDWQVTILHITNEELANQLEIEDIRNHSSVAPNGYNLTAGGDGIRGYHHTKETCKNISKALKGNKNSPDICGDKNPMKDPKIAAKQSEKSKGKKKRKMP